MVNCYADAVADELADAIAVLFTSYICKWGLRVTGVLHFAPAGVNPSYTRRVALCAISVWLLGGVAEAWYQKRGTRDPKQINFVYFVFGAMKVRGFFILLQQVKTPCTLFMLRFEPEPEPVPEPVPESQRR